MPPDRSPVSSLPPATWTRAQALFHHATDLPPGQRAAWLARECGDDLSLHRLVEGLLTSDEQPAALFDGPHADLVELVADDDDHPSPEAAPGEMLGPYRVIDVIARGGMGVVYSGIDVRLQRPVALKLIRPDRAAPGSTAGDLRTEARLLSALDHPNIATVYAIDRADDGRVFVAMAHYRGETLATRLARGPLPAGESLRIALGVASGLAAAHRAGIVHRDVKPANIMLTETGEPRLLDFGVAILLRDESHPSGMRAGTPGYMPPEQARGEPVDARADVWALGVVLWEMLAGRRLDPPPSGSHRARTWPPPLPGRWTLPSRVSQVIRKALAIDPGSRYANGGELVRALEDGSNRASISRRVGAGLATVLVISGILLARTIDVRDVPDGVAVLPFAVASSDPDAARLADAAAEGLTSDLGTLGRLRVIGWGTASRLRDPAVTTADVGANLNVESVIQGTVVGDPPAVFLHVRLTEAATGRVRWSRRFPIDQAGLALLRRRLALDLAGLLGAPGGAMRARLDQGTRVGSEAYDLYVRGRQTWNRRTSESLPRAIALFEEAIDVAPGFAEAWSGLANALFTAPQYTSATMAESMPQALRAARRAIALDPTLGDAYSALGAVHDTWDLDFRAAGDAFRKAIDADPGNATAMHYYGLHLSALGRHDEAREVYARALRIDPRSPLIVMAAGFPDLYARRYDDALAQFRRALEVDPTFILAHVSAGRALTGLGRYAEAVSEFERAGEGLAPAIFGHHGVALARGGDVARARALARRWSGASPMQSAYIAAALGEHARALDLLDQAYADRTPGLMFLNQRAELDPLRQEPRFRALVARLFGG